MKKFRESGETGGPQELLKEQGSYTVSRAQREEQLAQGISPAFVTHVSEVVVADVQMQLMYSLGSKFN